MLSEYEPQKGGIVLSTCPSLHKEWLLFFVSHTVWKEKTAATEDTTTTDCDCIQHQNHHII